MSNSTRVMGVAALGLVFQGLYGCGYDRSLEKHVQRGTPQSVELPVRPGKEYEVRASHDNDSVLLNVGTGDCVTATTTPITQRKDTITTMRPGTALLVMGLGAGLGALGAATWAGAKDRPKECAVDSKDCLTQGDARVAAVVSWGLGAAALGWGGYKLFAPGARQEGKPTVSSESLNSKPHPCAGGLAGIATELRLPNGAVLSGSTNGEGQSRITLPRAVLAGLRRGASAQIAVGGKPSGSFPLVELVTDWQRANGFAPGVLHQSPVVGASGQLDKTGVRIEVSVSPQDRGGEFLGEALAQGQYRLENVRAVPLSEAGAAQQQGLPLEVRVLRAEASAVHGQNAAVLVFDSSGSMSSNDPGREGRLTAARAFLGELQGSAEVAIMDFGAGQSGSFRASRLLQDFTRDGSALDEALSHLTERGGTPLYESINDALGLLESEKRGGALVVLTDGAAAGDHDATVARAQKQGVPIYTVGLGKSLDFPSLRALGLETGGFFVEAADAKTLSAAFRGVGVGVSVGKVRVFAQGPANAELRPGRYRVTGTIVTQGDQQERRIASPFELTTQAN
jgi:Mg-chelatase subunit ChlD